MSAIGGDAAAAAREIPDLLAGRTVAAAESCTAGRVTAALAAAGGAADWLRGGLTAYQRSIKQELLGLTVDDVLCEQAAAEMAVGACSLFGADVAVATTGVIGERAVDGVAPGTVFVATLVDEATITRRYESGSARPDQQSAHAAFCAVAQLAGHLRRQRVGGAGAAHLF